MTNPFAGTRLYARLGNAITRPLWSLLPTPRGFAVLTTTGRKTGKARQKSIRAIRQGDTVYAVAMMGARTAWLRNIRTHPHVTIRIGAATLHGAAHAVTEPDEKQRAREAYTQTTHASDYVDYAVYHWAFPTRSKIERAHRQWFEDGVPVIIHLNAG